MDPLPSTLRNRGQVLGTRREKGGSFPHYQSEMSHPSIPSWESPSDWTQTKVKYTSGWVYLPPRLLRMSGHKELCIQTVVRNNQNPQFPELAAQVLECSFPFSPKLRWKRHQQLSSETTLPRPMWSCEEMAIQWLEFTHGMNHPQHEMTSLQSGTNK